MTDIADELRNPHRTSRPTLVALCADAADEIERLRELARHRIEGGEL